jgi:branched-chain amino acid transport system substrate-binding protein
MMRTRPLTTAVSAVALTVVLAACGSSSGSAANSGASSTAATGSATSSAVASGTGGAGKDTVTNYVTYTKGKSGAANMSLPPVTVGWINQQGGSQVVGPLATEGAETAVKYINSHLGGVDGHPVQLKECFIQNAEQQGTTCAQEMLADKSVDVINEGAVAIGIQPFYSTLAGAKPVIVGVALSGTDPVQKNAVIYFGDDTHVLAPIATYGKQVLHAKTAAVIYPNVAGITDGAESLIQSIKAAGIAVKSATYDESNPDLIGPLTSSGAASADMVAVYTDSSGCVNIAKGLQQLSIPAAKIVSAPECLNGLVAKGLGGSYPIWTYSIASSLFGDPTDPGMPAYEKATAALEPAADAPDPWNIVAFSQLLTTDRLMNELGYAHLSPAAILAKARAFKGPLVLGAPSLDCGKYPAAPAVCNDRAQFFAYKGGKTFDKTASWLQPPS